MSQHLVCENNPHASRAVMLAAAAAAIRKAVGTELVSTREPVSRTSVRFDGADHWRAPLVSAAACIFRTTENAIALLEIASAARGSIYVMAEELQQDVEFNAVDELYRGVGLRRTRHVWLAFRANREEPIGAAIVYRGPLGVNFSYLENRCDLLLHPTLPQSEVSEVASSLLKASSAAYEDFELDEIPVIAEEMATHVLFKLGADFLRHKGQMRLSR
jgi:hypothetical protein